MLFRSPTTRVRLPRRGRGDGVRAQATDVGSSHDSLNLRLPLSPLVVERCAPQEGHGRRSRLAGLSVHLRLIGDNSEVLLPVAIVGVEVEEDVAVGSGDPRADVTLDLEGGRGGAGVGRGEGGGKRDGLLAKEFGDGGIAERGTALTRGGSGGGVDGNRRGGDGDGEAIKVNCCWTRDTARGSQLALFLCLRLCRRQPDPSRSLLRNPSRARRIRRSNDLVVAAGVGERVREVLVEVVVPSDSASGQRVSLLP